MLRRIDDLLELARQIPVQRMVVVAADDEPVLEAVCHAVELGIIEATLIGKESLIKEKLSFLHQNSACYAILHADSLEEAAALAMKMVREGKADIIMKGLIDTKILLKAVVNKEQGIRQEPILSHVGLASFPDLNRVLFFSDGAMLIAPTVEERIHLINNALNLLDCFGYQQPKIGLVSAVEKVNPKMQSTVDASEIVALCQEGAIRKGIVDGPFAIDNLVSEEASRHKGITSPVAGHCDLMVFPNIESGNVFYKTSVFLGKAKTAGIVLGAMVPIVLTSRADSSESKFNSILLSAIYAYKKGK
ncbi:MAG: bifunctional enoyl-CoA hydratase/phosphate acetyltransferase [Bacilli bacterium]|jgi:phosphate butyryltransferase|nr:bifunctional enoyl-CoA hydratase/phosphate acetyltransferase [Bacilli bacterium]MDY0064126.1 bifunctional enoyl-CoA hydratase/phosphate acetyltransferase [Bacilli bacterium]